MSGYDEEALVDYLKETVTEIIRKSNVLTDKLIWLLLRKKLSIGKDMLEKHIDESKGSINRYQSEV